MSVLATMKIGSVDLGNLAAQIKQWAKELGFSQAGVSDIDLTEHAEFLQRWLANGYHGEMDYMARNTELRTNPSDMLPGSLRIISVRMDYLPPSAHFAKQLKETTQGYVSRYAFGRDYHKVLRKRLTQLGEKIQQHLAEMAYRPLVDSAPVLEHLAAQKAGIGWTGKHSLTLNENAGSWFFLGELLVNLPLPVDEPQTDKCGKCVACIKACPTGAIVEPYVVDARRCISYLTIEFNGSIPEDLRPLMGNRIYGCDDCQLVCPWNRFSNVTQETDFHLRDELSDTKLLSLLHWDEAHFLKALEGSPIRRIGHEQWQRNIAVAIGNAVFNKHEKKQAIQALQHCIARSDSELVKEHAHWALTQLTQPIAKQVEPMMKTSRLIRAIEKGLPRDA